MFETLQPWALGLTAVLDTALLVVLLDRRNRPFALVPIVLLLLGGWLFHVGALFALVIAPLPGMKDAASLCVVVMAAGLLLKPSSLLHASVRLWRTGMDFSPPPTPWYALAYLPMLVVLPLARGIQPPEGSAIMQPLLIWAVPYVAWSSAINLLAAATLIRLRTRISLPGVGAFFLLFAGLLIAQSILNVLVLAIGRDAGSAGGNELLFACGLPSVAVTAVFAYFLIRHNFLRLAAERAIVYGALLAVAAMIHQLAFQEATLALPDSYRPALVPVEAVLFVMLIAFIRPLRQRLAEALRYLMGARVDGVRDRLREMSMQLSLQAGRPADEMLCWFAAELQASLRVEFVAGWLFRASGNIRTRFGAANRLSEAHIAALAGQMTSRGLAVCTPPFVIDRDGTAAFQAAGVSLAVRKSYQSMEGLLCVGRHARGRDLSHEEANAVVLLVEQLTVALENSLLLADRLAAERRAGHLEKLSALGLMASSIAHEVKNPLSAIKTIAAVLAEDLGPDSPHAEDLAMIRGEIDRLTTTTQQLLEFSRPAANASASAPIQLERIVSSTAQIMRRLAMQRDIAIETRFGDDLPPVRADETTLREIFFNLVANSLDAAGAGGRVTLICTRLNGHIVTEVRDSGPGLSLEVRNRLFEPFVTTKSAGTGLGLYVANRRVTELGGEIAYEEGPNGTSFIVKIPAL